VARRVVADGRLNGVAIVPSGEWGRASPRHLPMNLSLGGSVLDSQRYDSSQADFADIKTVMQVVRQVTTSSRKARSPTRPRIAAMPPSFSWHRARRGRRASFCRS
jgi:hypothetical protein